ncbi:hypothetical protein DVH24_003973 [Malus domestica]|uniref:Uncharacterized protein n=1 Tax=Malus domestica TaxID=3750 RepID=A0A498K729_MALDO|nr:hypothetical protein DVH24_003973 [Malus domestica]
MRENNVQVGPVVDKYISEHNNLARMCGLVSIDGKIAGSFAVTDPVKLEAARVISYLHSINITRIMVTGDNWATAAASVMEVGIDKLYAETDPLGKADRIKELPLQLYYSYRGGVSGLQLPSSTRDVGMAIGAGTDVAIEAAYSSDEEQLGRCSYSH